MEWGGAIVGTPDGAVRGVERLWQASSKFSDFLIITNDWATREQALRSYEMFARYVVPPLPRHVSTDNGGLRVRLSEVGPGLLQAAIQAMIRGVNK